MPVRKKTYIQRSSGKAIFSSKMFLASTNQEKIRAAFADNANLELIRQLDEYLGDEYIALLKPEKQKEEKPESVDNQVEEAKPENTTEEQKQEKSGSPIKPSLREDYTKLEKDMEKEADMDTVAELLNESEASAETETSSDTAVENSTAVDPAKAIESATTVMPISYEDAVTEIKGILNADSATAGVSRVQKKDDEVWIYYKDSVNLNNIMDLVIETMDSASYTWMIFNRLARSDNAMVFAVLKDDTLENIPSPPVTHKV